MISVIVPVYNVETYLPKCLDSILAQTCADLEILLIDDGSTDRCGEICDHYAARDPRIRGFHTENRGLSAARNLGLDHAKGEYVGFVDSDDWIEPDMYACLLEAAERTGADVAECGVFREYKTKTIESPADNKVVSEQETLPALIGGEIQTLVWNKLWRRSLFAEIRFPVGRYYEDIATTYKLLRRARVAGVDRISYHYIQRDSGICQSHDRRNLIDYWLAHKGCYDDLIGEANQETEEWLLKSCASAIARTWVWYLKSEKAPQYIKEMSSFARKKYPAFGSKGWPVSLRACVFLARYNTTASFAAAYAMNQLYRLLKPKYYE